MMHPHHIPILHSMYSQSCPLANRLIKGQLSVCINHLDHHPIQSTQIQTSQRGQSVLPKDTAAEPEMRCRCSVHCVEQLVNRCCSLRLNSTCFKVAERLKKALDTIDHGCGLVSIQVFKIRNSKKKIKWWAYPSQLN